MNMNYEQINMGSYNLHIIKTNKFKTITMEVNFRRKIKKEEITLRNLLKMMLLYTTKQFKTERDFIIETENLYDLKVVSSNMRIGNYSNLSFKIRFLNEKYTEKNMNEYSISFLMDVLFNPNVENGSFKIDDLKILKNKLAKSIKKLSDNKIKYSLLKLMSTTDNMPYSYNSYGDIEDLDKITENSLYQYYKNVLADDLVDIFVVGDVDVNEIKKYLKKYFKIETFKKDKKDFLVSELIPRKRIKKVVEKEDVNQSQLTALCTLNNLSEFERKYTLLIYNEILGGSSNSLLFNTIREKNSYAYYINSSAKAYDNILMIYSGIDPGNSDNVLKLIKKVLFNINKGKFNDEILESAKETIISSIKASTDTPTGIINTYYAKHLVNADLFEERINNIKKITKEDIINLSKKISMHTVFLLEGNIREDYS